MATPISNETEIYANFSETIDTILDNYKIKAIKRDYLRNNILTKVEVQWRYNPRFRNLVIQASELSLEDQRRIIFEIIEEFARDEVDLETRNLQIEAEEKLLYNLVKGSYFKKDGFKNLRNDISNWFGPLGRNIRTLEKLKLSDDPDRVRTTLLDLALPDTKKGLSGIRTLLGEYIPEEDIGMKSSLRETAVDIALGKTLAAKPRTFLYDLIDDLKKAYDSERDEIYKIMRELRKDATWLEDELLLLRQKYEPQLEELVTRANEFVHETMLEHPSGRLFTPLKGLKTDNRFKGIAESTSYEKSETESDNVFSYSFRENGSLVIVDEIQDFYDEGTKLFINSNALSFVSRNVDLLRHFESLTELRELEIQSYANNRFLKFAQPDFLKMLDEQIKQLQPLISTNPELKSQLNALLDLKRRADLLSSSNPANLPGAINRNALSLGHYFSGIESSMLSSGAFFGNSSSVIGGAKGDLLTSFLSFLDRVSSLGINDTSQLTGTDLAEFNQYKIKLQKFIDFDAFNFRNTTLLNELSSDLYGITSLTDLRNLISGKIIPNAFQVSQKTLENKFLFQELDDFKYLLTKITGPDLAGLSDYEKKVFESLRSKFDSHIANRTIEFPLESIKLEFLSDLGSIATQSNGSSILTKFDRLQLAVSTSSAGFSTLELVSFINFLESVSGKVSFGNLLPNEKKLFNQFSQRIIEKIDLGLIPLENKKLLRRNLDSLVRLGDLSNLTKFLKTTLTDELYKTSKIAAEKPPELDLSALGFSPIQVLKEFENLAIRFNSLSPTEKTRFNELRDTLKSLLNDGILEISDIKKKEFLAILDDQANPNYGDSVVNGFRAIKFAAVSQFNGPAGRDLSLLQSFIQEMSSKSITNYSNLSEEDKKRFDYLKHQMLMHLELNAFNLGVAKNSALINLINLGDFAQIGSYVTSNVVPQTFTYLSGKNWLGVLTSIKKISEVEKNFSQALGILRRYESYSALSPKDKLELDKILAFIRELIEKNPKFNISSDLKNKLLYSINQIGNPAEFLNLRFYLFEVHKVVLLERLTRSKNSAGENYALDETLQSILKKKRAVTLVLSVLNSMKSVRTFNTKELDEFNRNKKALIEVLDVFGFNSTQMQEIRDALARNDYKILRKYFSSGIFGSKVFDSFLKNLNQETLQYAHKIGNTSFANSLTLRALNSQVMDSFVNRKYLEQIIMLAQMVTDEKYFFQEVKRTLQVKILNYYSSRWKRFLDKAVGNNSPTRNLIDTVIGILRDSEVREDPAKYFAKKLITEVFDVYIGGFIKKRFERFLKFKVFGKKYTIDPTELIKNPATYLVAFSKDLFIREAKNLIYKKIIMKYFKNSKLIRRFRLLRARIWKFRKRFNLFLEKIPARLAKFLGDFTLKTVTKINANVGAWLLRIAGGSTNPIGWAIIAFVIILPIIMKPFVGDVNYFEALKRSILVCCLVPFIILGFLFVALISPVLSLFSYLGGLWDGATSTIAAIGDMDPVNEFVSSFNDPNNLVVDYSRVNASFGGISGGVIGSVSFLQRGFTDDFNQGCVDPLMDSQGKPATDSQGRMIFKPQNYTKRSDWMNLDLANNELVNAGGPNNNDALSFSIKCHASFHLSQLFPGDYERDNQINCHLGKPGMYVLSDWGASRYWCTRILDDAYEGFRAVTGSSKVHTYNTFFNNNYSNGNYVGWHDITYSADRFSSQCFRRSELNKISGAMMILNGTQYDPDMNNTNYTGYLACNNPIGRVTHVTMFQEVKGDRLYFVQSNAGRLKSSVQVRPCTRSGYPTDSDFIEISIWSFSSNSPEVGQYICGIYFPNRNKYKPEELKADSPDQLFLNTAPPPATLLAPYPYYDSVDRTMKCPLPDAPYNNLREFRTN